MHSPNHRELGIAIVAVCLLFKGPAIGQPPQSKLIAELRTAPVAQRAEIAKQLQNDPATKLMDLVAAMSTVDPVLKNVYLGVAQTIAERGSGISETELQTMPKNAMRCCKRC